MATVVKKNNKKTNIPVAVWFILLGGAVIVGAASLLDGRLLKTQVGPGEGGTSTVRDWESIGAPDLSSVMVGPTEFCPSPTPASSSLSSPTSSPKPSSSPFAYLEAGETRGGRVLGWPIPYVTPTTLSCPEGFIAEGFNEYEYILDKSEDNILRNPVNGLDPGYILTAVCEGNPSVPQCRSRATVGCSWMESIGFSDINLTGLYHKVSGLYKLVESAYVYPDGFGRPDTKQQVPGVYPSPAESDDELLFALGMSLWKLSSGDEQELKERHPKLLEVAQRQINGIEEHEKVHWGIFERYLPNYMAMINRPWYDTDWSVLTLESLQSLIGDEFRSGWQSVAVLEEAEHEAFHERADEEMVREGDFIPYDGLDNIICPYMEGMVGPFALLVSGKGYASADYDIHGTGGRVMNTDSYEVKEYFTNTGIKIEARPKEGYRFRGWQSPAFDKPCAGCAGSKNPVCTLQISSKGDACGAVFDPVGSPSPTRATTTLSPSSQPED